MTRVELAKNSYRIAFGAFGALIITRLFTADESVVTMVYVTGALFVAALLAKAYVMFSDEREALNG